jgi:hypothetical protein
LLTLELKRPFFLLGHSKEREAELRDYFDALNSALRLILEAYLRLRQEMVRGSSAETE